MNSPVRKVCFAKKSLAVGHTRQPLPLPATREDLRTSSWVNYLDFRSLLREAADADLFGFDFDKFWRVVPNKMAVSKAIEQVFDTCRIVVVIEESAAEARKANERAAQDRFFSFWSTDQWTFVLFALLGGTYLSVSFKECLACIGKKSEDLALIHLFQYRS